MTLTDVTMIPHLVANFLLEVAQYPRVFAQLLDWIKTTGEPRGIPSDREQILILRTSTSFRVISSNQNVGRALLRVLRKQSRQQMRPEGVLAAHMTGRSDVFIWVEN